MKTSMKNSLISLIMAIIIVAGSVFSFGAETGDIIYIDNIRDFMEFAKNCVNDSYSRNKTFKLTADIDLSGEDFKPVPIFCGTFLGDRHTISGVKITEKGSNTGFFRYIDKGASVVDLKLTANVRPSGTKENIGILCGVNRGTIDRCTINGYVTGEKNIGGIAGVNEKDAVIQNSISNANVFGNDNVGGITGINDGEVSTVTSKGYLNTDADRVANNTGGIAGVNNGKIEYCYNYGIIGYKHSGYNVGGIAGIHKGMIMSSYNYAQIMGRKDIGGIAGQFEPYITMEYGANAKDKLREELKSMNGYFSQFFETLNNAVDIEMNAIESINSNMREINDILNNSIDYLTEDVSETSRRITGNMENIEESGQAISEASDRFRSEMDSSMGALENATDEFIAAMRGHVPERPERPDPSEPTDPTDPTDPTNPDDGEGSGDEGSDSGTDLPDFPDFPDWNPSELPDYNEIIDEITRYISRVTGIISDTGDNTAKFLSAMSGSVEDITSAISDIQHELDDCIGNQMGNLSKTSNKLNKHISLINDQVDIMTSEAKSANDDIKTSADNIIESMNSLVDIVYEMTETPEFKIEDVSAIISEEPREGEIRSCQNFGIVNGDSNTGGIAGIMAKELSSDPEEDFLSTEDILVDTTAIFRTLVLGCTNNAQVIVKNECGGGIVGKSDVGAVCKSTNKGNITVNDGNYCGGIAGASKGDIVSCYVQSVLEGNDEVGGIAGFGNNIKNCYSMAVIKSEGEKIGSIAGKAEGTLEQNYFVDEGYPAVDSINYENIAFPISYEEFKAIETIPKSFFTYRVNFIVNGNTIKTIPVEYGGSINKKEIPAIPEYEGYYGEWEEFPMENILRTVDVNCIYTPLITTIATEEEIPLLLVEGKFSPKGKVRLTELKLKPEIDEEYEILACYNISVTDIKPVEGALKARIKCPSEEKIEVYTFVGDEITPLSFERDGNYIVANLENDSDVLIVKKPSNRDFIIMIIAIGLAGLAAIVYISFKIKARAANKHSENPLPKEVKEMLLSEKAVKEIEKKKEE